jgi:ectoine hydroxylase-related dioxygenase (phytanoyl-CoA dioxygenase family)
MVSGELDWAALRTRYKQDGYLVFPHVLDSDLVSLASRHVEWLQQTHPDTRPEQLHHQLMWEDPFWVRLVSDRRILDLVEPLIGPNIALFASHYICKPGGDGLPVLWHQDGSYWPLEPMEVVTAWLAVDDSDEENGCMRVIPGSHRGPMLTHHRHQRDAVLGTEIRTEDLDESRAVDVRLPAGSVSLHHPMLVHGSNPNLSSRRRCGLTIRYIPTTTRITREPWKSFLFRGREVEGINGYSPLPPYDAARHFPGYPEAVTARSPHDPVWHPGTTPA